MIFSLHFSLIMAGYSSAGILLGSYMIRYAGASELDLGFIFMIQPLTVFTRPFICARADRFQTHKQLLTISCFCNSIAYIPFIILPFLLEYPRLEEILTVKLRFWILVTCHVIGSLAFCGTRSLGDALAVNYAKRVNSDFTMYRKYGAISFGVCGFGLGLINQNWILPDFVPSFIMNVFAMFLLMILIYLWPSEYFVMVSDKPRSFQGLSTESGAKASGGQQQQQQVSSGDELPVGRELARRIRQKLAATLVFWRRPRKRAPEEPVGGGGAGSRSRRLSKQLAAARTAAGSPPPPPPPPPLQPEQEPVPLTMGQQVRIFLLLTRRDVRLPLFLLLLLYGGFVGYAPQNFAFTYMNEFCHERATCDGASLSGLVMISYCLCETICYLVINSLRAKLNYVWLLQLTLLSLTIHYYSYGFLLPVYLSPYIFLIESLHGLEYSASLSSGVELAYKFANEVDLLIPELIERQIITERDNKELVRLSLMATMNGCFTLVYDGFGTIIGSFIYGLVTDTYSFTVTWRLIGTLAASGFLAVSLIVLLGRHLDVKPQIHRLAASRSQPGAAKERPTTGDNQLAPDNQLSA